MSNLPTHTERVDRFKADLKELTPETVIRKHITTGHAVELTEDRYFELRNLVAAEFQLHPAAVIVVGSCRQGFSITEKKNKKRYRQALATSDLDVALISRERFDEYWDDVFAYSRSDRAWKHSDEYRDFVRMLFNGWIDPRGLPSVPRFERAGRWTEFFDKLMRTRQFGRRRITARLYRNWDRLEAYQHNSVQRCIATLGA